MRTANITRKTNETDCTVEINLDGTGQYDIQTGVGFFNHMLEQLAKHSQIDMKIHVKGDLHIDDHHTVEDTGIALGQALRKALSDSKGIQRYASCHLPMDECLMRSAIDVSGRAFLVFNIPFPTAKIGSFDTELVREFFQAFAMQSGITLHLNLEYGINSHHIAESAFKATAIALRQAIAVQKGMEHVLPSTKGVL